MSSILQTRNQRQLIFQYNILMIPILLVYCKCNTCYTIYIVSMTENNRSFDLIDSHLLV